MTNRDDSDRSSHSETGVNPTVARAIQSLRKPVSLSPDFEEGVMRRVRAEEGGGSRWLATAAWHLPLALGRHDASAVRLRPLAIAAGVAALAAGLALALLRFGAPTRGAPQVQFVLTAPGAHSVAVLGDFNHWSATPLRLVRRGSGTWSTTVRLAPGRHVYSFLIDGTRWVADPQAPRSLDDDFGRPSAVVTVPGRST